MDLYVHIGLYVWLHVFECALIFMSVWLCVCESTCILFVPDIGSKGCASDISLNVKLLYHP